ncbi:hypothetical protein ACTVZO_17820 [Streptomyces sp. IBSNAI002]|uniref:hypothetical protein n=1 Tax=Streptomyces sp. IBSNAI002 TaxID=3457500 RepID=UPI003FD21073
MATLASMTVRLGIDTDQLRAGAEAARGHLTTLAKGVAGLGVGLPAIAAVTAGIGGMVAAFATAGIAAKAFQLALKPQLESIAEASSAAEAAEAAHAEVELKQAKAAQLAAKGGKAYKAALEDVKQASEAAKDADRAYQAQLDGLPPATREAAVAQKGLKDAYKDWSDSLAVSTMPVMTQGIGILTKLMPLLTPFVKSAAGALKEFLGEVSAGVSKKGLPALAERLAEVAGKNLKSFLVGIRNIGVGIGGLIGAFTPLSDNMSGGFERATAAFAAWGKGLGESEGFAKFVDLARQGAATLGALAESALRLLVAIAPLIGVTALLAGYLANLINSLPPWVLENLAMAIMGVVVAMRLYRIGAAATALATRLLASSTYLAIAGWTRMLAFGLVAYARIAAGAVVSAATTAGAWVGSALVSIGTWVAAVVRAAAVAVAQFVMMAARAVLWAAIMAAQWLIAMGPIGWIIAAVIGLVALIIYYWDEIKAFTVRIWSELWARAKELTTRNIGNIVGFIGGLPGQIQRIFASAATWLVNAGKNVVTGLWNGIQSMGGWLRSTLMGWARNLIPGPIAKALGIASPSRVMAKQVGRWIPAGIVEGAESGQGELDAAMRQMVTVPGMKAAGQSPTGANGPTRAVVEFDFGGADSAFKTAISKVVRTKGQGSPTTAFGQR